MNGEISMATPSSAPRKTSLLRTVKAVAWSFIGVGKNSEFHQDLARVNPIHVIAIGIGGALMFVLVLVGIVNWVVAK